MNPLASEPEFRALLMAGNQRGAAEWLVRRYADDVFGLCSAMVSDSSAAEDLAQDVFGRAFGGLNAFRGEASPRTWLLAIARNRCIDHLRARLRDPWGGGSGDEAEPDAHPDEAPLPADLLLRRDDVESALSELSEADRAMIVLRYRNGLEYAELASAFGIREGSVRMRVSRALAKMRARLEARHATLAPGAPLAAPAPLPARPAPLAGRAASRPVPAAPSTPAGPPPPPAMAPPPAPAAGRGPPMETRLRASFAADRGPTHPPPAGHPLTEYFAATRELAGGLMERLLQAARRA